MHWPNFVTPFDKLVELHKPSWNCTQRTITPKCYQIHSNTQISPHTKQCSLSWTMCLEIWIKPTQHAQSLQSSTKAGSLLQSITPSSCAMHLRWDMMRAPSCTCFVYSCHRSLALLCPIKQISHSQSRRWFVYASLLTTDNKQSRIDRSHAQFLHRHIWDTSPAHHHMLPLPYWLLPLPLECILALWTCLLGKPMLSG